MNDPEVARLRRLRDASLRSRAIARALMDTRWGAGDPLLKRAACAGWRIARAASGRLTAHPYLKYHQGPTLLSLLWHAVRSRCVAIIRRSRLTALAESRGELERLARVVADVRAVTLAPDLSATLGRAQWEIDTLVTALAHEASSAATEVRVTSRLAGQRVAGERMAGERVAGEPAPAALAPPLATDWPYLAL